MNCLKRASTILLTAILLPVAATAPDLARAQITFRNATSAAATANAPTFRAQASATLATIGFRAAASATSGSGTLTIARPAGVVADDVMIASIGVQPSSATITPPAGWTLVRRVDNANPNSNSLAVYIKVAGAGEPASYSWTIGGSTFRVGGIQAFTNVDTTNPIDVENGQCTPPPGCATATTSHATPSVTTTVANAMVVTSHTYASSRNWTPPAGMSESFDRVSGALGAVGQSIEGNRQLQATAGATGVKTATAAGNADVGNTHILALRPALIIARPAGTAVNDVLIASIGVRPSSATITPPAGWTLVRRVDQGAGTTNSLAVYYKVATASEPTSYRWSVAGATFAVGGIQGFFRVNTASPIDVENGQATPSALTHSTPSVTTTVANAMVVTSHTYASSRNWTPPAGMSESFDRVSGALGAVGQSIEGNRVLQPAAGATGVKTATAAADADVGNTHILALRPASVTLTIATPAGTVANDVLIAAIGSTFSTATITPPAGWTLVRRVDNPNANSNSLAVYRRVAAAGEPASHSWSLAGATFAVGGIQSFIGVDTANPIDVENGQCTPQPGCATATTTHATPSVTTTVANAMIVTSHTYSSSRNWTPPAGMTESFDRRSGANSATGQSIEGNRQLQAAAGATGVKTAVAAGNGDVGNTHILALRPGPPELLSATVVCGTTSQVEVLFSKAVTAATAENPANYALDGGATVSAATLGADGRLVTLTTSTLDSRVYTLTVNNVADASGNTVPANSQVTFFSEGGYLSGLKGTYYDQNGVPRAYFTGNTVVRIDGPVDFNWGAGAPVAGIGANDFSVVWEGFVMPSASGNFIFRTRSDDGVRLYVNGVLVINNWTDHAATNNNSAPIALTAFQRYPIRMEYYERAGQAVAQLSWSGPGTGGFQFIPRSALSYFCGLPTPVALYKMDEASWSGVAGEVKDSGGNDIHGSAVGGANTSSASPAIPGSPGTCGYGVFNGSSAYVAIPHTPALNGAAALTYTAWINPSTWSGTIRQVMSKSVHGGGSGRAQMGMFSEGGVLKGRAETAGGRREISTTLPALSTWTHLALVFGGSSLTLYVNGVAAAGAGFASTTLIGNNDDLFIGNDVGRTYYFPGSIDEARVYNVALTQADVAAVMNKTRPCVSPVDHYAISYPGGSTGVTCDPSEVQFMAHAADHSGVAPGAGTALAISTSTGAGVWQPGLLAGTGTWTPSGANDGAATYVWPGGESSFRVRLRQNTPATININLLDGNGRTEAPAEDPSIQFVDAAFRVTADGTSAASIGTHLAGKDSNAGFGAQVLYLQAIRTDTNTGSCVGLIQNQTVTVPMAGARMNPTGGASQVSVRDSGGSMVALGTGAGAPGAYTDVSLAFDAQSKAPLVFNYPDAGAISLYARYELPAPPAGEFVSGSSNNFVVRPFGLRVSGVTTAAAPGPGSPAFVRAGENFNVTVTAVRWKTGDDADNDGVPDSDAQIAANAATPNFDHNNVVLSHALNAPSGGNPGTLGGSTTFSGFSAGAKTQAVNWSEVGFINLFAQAADYLGSGQTVRNSIAGLTGVGRFYPDHLFVPAGSTLTNRAAAACSPASSFTYLGEGLAVSFMLEARNVAGAVTQNYTTASGFAKLDPTAAAQLGFGAVSGTSNLTSRIAVSSASSVGFLAGQASVTATLAVDRAAAPDGPFASARIGIAPVDSDGVALRAADLDMDVDGAGGNDHRQVGAATELRFGRLFIRNAHGSQLVPLPMPLETQYFGGPPGNAFITNTADSCTAIAANNIAMSNFTQNLAACETAIPAVGAFNAGRSTFTLAAPGSGNDGSVNLTANLGSTGSGTTCTSVGGATVPVVGANLLFLRGNWTGGAYNEDPSARATFGLYKGSEEVIFIRENF